MFRNSEHFVTIKKIMIIKSQGSIFSGSLLADFLTRKKFNDKENRS